MLNLADALAQNEPAPVAPRERSAPSGWEPGIVWNPSKGGHIVTDALAAEPDPKLWAELIKDWGIDPATTEVVDGSIEVIGWDGQIGAKLGGGTVRLKRYKAKLRPRGRALDRADVDELCAIVMRRKPIKAAEVAGTDRALVVPFSDLQMGKGEGGGSAAAVDRIVSAIDAIPRRLREFRKLGRPIDSVYLVGMGDLVEQCAGHYAMQAFTVDLDRREQMRVVRRLMLYAVDVVAPLVERVVLTGVPGNHGESRNDNGKAFTSWTDNDDLAVLEQVGEVLASNPERYPNVTTVLPTALDLTLDVAGTIVSFVHGHQWTAKGAVGIEAWLAGQAVGRTKVADCDILVTGHRHHLLVSEATGRTVLQCPALDGGSAWFTAQSGNSSPAGLLSFVAGTGCGPRGWSDLAVLS